MTVMEQIGQALRDRMNTSLGASFTIQKVGPVWRVKYRDEHGSAEVSSLGPENAVLALARELGFV